MASTRNLLAYGIWVIRTGAFIDTDPRSDPDHAVDRRREAVQKLTLGLIALVVLGRDVGDTGC